LGRGFNTPIGFLQSSCYFYQHHGLAMANISLMFKTALVIVCLLRKNISKNGPLNSMSLKFRPTQAFTKDTGLIVVLILLLTAYWTGKSFFLPLSIGTLLVVMTVPMVFKPVAIVWYYFSATLGQVTNRIVLTIIFVCVLVPVGVIRRYLGFDPMKRKAWKKGVNSVFTERHHTFTADDFDKPY
jgi:hypothetical protein